MLRSDSGLRSDFERPPVRVAAAQLAVQVVNAAAKVKSVQLRTIAEGGDNCVLGISYRDWNIAVEGDLQDAFANPDAVNLRRNLQRSAEPGWPRSLAKALF